MRTPTDAQVLAWLRQRYAARKVELEAMGALIASMERGEDTPGTPGVRSQASRPRPTGTKTTADYVLDVLTETAAPMTKREILERVQAAGWTTNATEPSETVRYAIGVLLNQRKVSRVGQHSYILAGVEPPAPAPVGVTSPPHTFHGGDAVDVPAGGADAHAG